MAAETAAEIIKKMLLESRSESGIKLLGPAPAIIEKLRGRYRWQMLLKAPSASALSSLLKNARPKIESSLPGNVRFGIDVDPLNLL